MKFSGEEKTMWVEDWRRSGKSVWSYAKENGLVPQTFARWTKEEAETKPCFVEVPAVIMPPPHQPAEILIENGGMRIHIPLTIGAGELRTVIEALGAAS
jgi:transposase-like protein